MIEIRHENGRFYPLLLCDVCRERITERGNVLYPESDQNGPPKFVHKDCDDHTVGGWEELDVFFYQLIHNAQVDLLGGQRSQELLEELG